MAAVIVLNEGRADEESVEQSFAGSSNPQLSQITSKSMRTSFTVVTGGGSVTQLRRYITHVK